MEENLSLENIISSCRANVIDILEAGAIGHPGGSLSILETLVALYYEMGRKRSNNPIKGSRL